MTTYNLVPNWGKRDTGQWMGQLLGKDGEEIKGTEVFRMPEHKY